MANKLKHRIVTEKLEISYADVVEIQAIRIGSIKTRILNLMARYPSSDTRIRVITPTEIAVVVNDLDKNGNPKTQHISEELSKLQKPNPDKPYLKRHTRGSLHGYSVVYPAVDRMDDRSLTTLTKRFGIPAGVDKKGKERFGKIYLTRDRIASEVWARDYDLVPDVVWTEVEQYIPGLLRLEDPEVADFWLHSLDAVLMKSPTLKGVRDRNTRMQMGVSALVNGWKAREHKIKLSLTSYCLSAFTYQDDNSIWIPDGADKVAALRRANKGSTLRSLVRGWLDSGCPADGDLQIPVDTVQDDGVLEDMIVDDIEDEIVEG